MHITKNSCAFWLLCLVHCLRCIFPVTCTSSVDNFLTKVINIISNENSSTVANTLNKTDMNPAQTIMTSSKLRVKRQSGGGKYTDAAQMPQVKVLRLVLQMIRNTWADAYVGGVHPFHHEVPKPVVQLFKQRIVDFFFPNVGDEYKKDK